MDSSDTTKMWEQANFSWSVLWAIMLSCTLQSSIYSISTHPSVRVKEYSLITHELDDMTNLRNDRGACHIYHVQTTEALVILLEISMISSRKTWT